MRATLEHGILCCEIDETTASDVDRLTSHASARGRACTGKASRGWRNVALLDQIEIYSQGDLQRFAES